ncbi:MAG: Holliday junction branch migration protein RuvA [Planctomycetota bacterium]|jgi:Holliday junction DNA helicase RuvA|nr:Holliday junction branch migration protein RuvA [Planctomycetota bacterium]
MYNHIRGRVVEKTPGRLVVESGGIGYEIAVPLRAARRFPEPGGEATVLLHLLVREDELRLIGFAESDERELFRRLIGLSGVGAVLALQILSDMAPRDFALAIERQDAGALRRVKGIGDKTAKRIILELKGAKTVLPPEEGGGPAGPGSEAAAALVALGISPAEAAARVEKALRDSPGLGVEDLIRAALR